MVYRAPLPCRSPAACEKQIEVLRCSMPPLEGLRKEAIHDTFTRAPSMPTPVIRRPLQEKAVPHGPDLLTSVLPLFVSLLIHPPHPSVSAICTVSFKGVKEINSNSPFPLLIKVMARKNGRQYQFIYHKLSISYYATTDCPLVGLPICTWYYFCFQAALMKMKEPLFGSCNQRWVQKEDRDTKNNKIALGPAL